MNSVLAFDLGGTCGWAFGKKPDALSAVGVLRTEPKRFESQGMRYIKFERGVRELLTVYKPDLVVFEKVERHSGTYAAHAYGAFSALLMKQCDEQGIPYEGYTVQAIKKHATTKTHASKELMLGMAKYKYPHLEFETDDAADAAHLCSLALSKL